MSNRIYTSVVRKGNRVIERGVNEDGTTYVDQTEFAPFLFMRTNTPSDDEYRGIDGQPLTKIQFEDAAEMREYLERYKDVEGHYTYGHRDITTQYIGQQYPGDIVFDYSKVTGCILDIEVFSGHREDLQFVFDGFPDKDLANKPINAITFFNTRTQRYHVYGLEQIEGVPVGKGFASKDNDVTYKGFDDEKSLLRKFLIDFASAQFHFISGWYVEFFDIPYIINRIKLVLGDSFAKQLSPHGFIRAKTLPGNFGKETHTYAIEGVPTIDYIDMFKKFEVGYTPRNWKLNTVAMDKIGDTKVPFDGPLQALYLDDYEKFIDYNIYDVRLIAKMEERNKFFDLALTLTHMMKSNMSDIFGTVRPWSNLLYVTLKNKGVLPQMRGVSYLDYPYVGGHVKDPKIGFSRWVCSFDFDSLYPHIMQQYNLGVETLVEYRDLPPELKSIVAEFYVDRDQYYSIEDVQNKIDDNIRKFIGKRVDLSPLKKYNMGITTAGQLFRNDSMSVFNQVTREIYDRRVEARGELKDLKKSHSADVARMTQLHNIQLTLKIMINSLYGAVANKYFTDYFDIRIAEAITSSGQRAVKWVANAVNAYINRLAGTENVDYIVAIDTDSNYVTLDAVVQKVFGDKANDPKFEQDIVDFIDRLCEERLRKVIDNALVDLADYTNARDQRMAMKREAIAVTAIWTAKKRYAMLLADLEGVKYPERKVKYTGLEALRSTYPEVCQQELVKCYDLLLRGKIDDIDQTIRDFRVTFKGLPLNRIAGSTSVNNIDKFIGADKKPIKGTPNHVKAAIFYNEMLVKCGVERYRPINDGDKTQLVPLKRNPQGYDVMAFDTSIPKEFALDRYIDYDKMFEKNFINPLQTICSVCGLNNIGETSEVESLF